jgi:nucleoporin NUP82
MFSSPRRGYTVDFDIPVPVSFTFASGSEWLSWTIFILTRDGDVYVLCPVLPTKCILSRSEIARMKILISQRSEAAKHDNSCSPAERETCLNQMRWISDILGQITMGEFMGVTSSPAFTGLETDDSVSFKRPNKVRPTPEIQGPVLFQPAPIAMDEILPEANEIAFLDADGVGVFVTTWAGGRVDVGVLVDEVEGVWAVKGVPREELPAIKVAAYESIDLPISEGMCTEILTSHTDDEGVFIAADGGVWQLDFRSWLHELLPSNEDNDDNNETFGRKKTSIKLIADERYPSLA